MEDAKEKTALLSTTPTIPVKSESKEPEKDIITKPDFISRNVWETRDDSIWPSKIEAVIHIAKLNLKDDIAAILDKAATDAGKTTGKPDDEILDRFIVRHQEVTVAIEKSNARIKKELNDDELEIYNKNPEAIWGTT